MAQNTENARPQYVEHAEIAEIETTRAFPSEEVCTWIRANRKDVPEQATKTFQDVYASAALSWESLDVTDRKGEQGYMVEGAGMWPELRPAVIEALQALELQAQAMERLRAALPKLEGCEGIQVYTMDSLLDKLCGPRVESEGQDVVVDREAETMAALDWQAEAPSTSEMEALVGMQEEDDEDAANMDPVAMGEWLANTPEGQALTGVVPDEDEAQGLFGKMDGLLGWLEVIHAQGGQLGNLNMSAIPYARREWREMSVCLGWAYAQLLDGKHHFKTVEAARDWFNWMNRIGEAIGNKQS